MEWNLNWKAKKKKKSHWNSQIRNLTLLTLVTEACFFPFSSFFFEQKHKH